MSLFNNPFGSLLDEIFTDRVPQTKKTGLSPGSAVFTGQVRVEEVTIELIRYNENTCEESVVEPNDLANPDEESVLWVNVTGLHDVELLQQVGEKYGLHPLTVEDVLGVGQQPKFEEFDEHAYIVARMLNYDSGKNFLDNEQVSIIVGRNVVLSFQEKPEDVFEYVRKRLRAGKGRMRRMGADYLAYCLLDAITDHLFVVLEELVLGIDQLEREQLADPKAENMQRLFDYREKLVTLRHTTMPLRDVVATMSKSDTEFITEEITPYLRDLHDHTLQVLVNVDGGREQLSSLLDFYHTQLGHRMNEIMKVLTVIATIFIPLTFIAGIYGMNFAHMPELAWKWSYPTLLVAMVATGLGMFSYFRRKNWF